jgi:hypothetical protein
MCGGQPSCTTTAAQNPNLRVDFQLGYNVAFVSSQRYSVGPMPPVGSAANQECARLAAAVGVHGSRWVAWLAAEGPSLAVGDDITPSQFLQNAAGQMLSATSMPVPKHWMGEVAPQPWTLHRGVKVREKAAQGPPHRHRFASRRRFRRRWHGAVGGQSERHRLLWRLVEQLGRRRLWPHRRRPGP